jgi:hypothetical protein
MFARRGVGCIWQENHVLALRGGQWTWLGGGASTSNEELLADRPAVLPDYLMAGRQALTGADPGVIVVNGTGGVLDDRGDVDRRPDRGRWINYAEVRVNADVTSVQVYDRMLRVPWHGRVLLVWSERQSPRVVASDEGGRALGEVILSSTR